MGSCNILPAAEMKTANPEAAPQYPRELVINILHWSQGNTINGTQ
jgi:hypothetical protein